MAIGRLLGGARSVLLSGEIMRLHIKTRGTKKRSLVYIVKKPTNGIKYVILGFRRVPTPYHRPVSDMW